jgi:ABC-type lipoprotein release transport system permease subunit
MTSREWFERHRYFLDFTISSLLRRKWKNASLILVYGLVVFMVSSVLLFTGAIRKEAEAILEDAPQIIVQRTIAGRHDLMPLNYADKIEKIRGVQGMSGRLWGYYYHPAARSNYTVMVSDDSPGKEDEAIVGHGVLRTWETDDQNRLYFKTYRGETITATVVKSFGAHTDLVSSDLILVSEPMFRRLFGVPKGFVTDLAVSVRNASELTTIADKCVNIFPDTRPILKDEIQRTYASLFDWRSGYIIVLLSGAVMAFFIFAWDKATGLTGEEKTEIGILKALGWDTSDILMLKFWEGMVICLTAFITGLIAAYVHVFLASAPLFEHALKGWAILYPSFKLNPDISAYQIGLVFALTVVPYTLITIIPAWRISITDPDAIMR